jgi:hypothetical protein
MDRSHDNFQRGGGSVGKVSLARQDGSQFGQDLGGEQRRSASNEWVGQIKWRELQSKLSVSA